MGAPVGVAKTRSQSCQAVPAARRSAFCSRRCARSWATRGVGRARVSLAVPRPSLTPLRRVKCQPPPVRWGHSRACAGAAFRAGTFDRGADVPAQRAACRAVAAVPGRGALGRAGDAVAACGAGDGIVAAVAVAGPLQQRAGTAAQPHRPEQCLVRPVRDSAAGQGRVPTGRGAPACVGPGGSPAKVRRKLPIVSEVARRLG